MIRLGKRLQTMLVPMWLALGPSAVSAQGAAGEVGGLRAYWHVFIAYTIAIALVLGWVVSIARRLRKVEERLGQR